MLRYLKLHVEVMHIVGDTLLEGTLSNYAPSFGMLLDDLKKKNLPVSLGKRPQKSEAMSSYVPYVQSTHWRWGRWPVRQKAEGNVIGATDGRSTDFCSMKTPRAVAQNHDFLRHHVHVQRSPADLECTTYPQKV